MKSKKYHTTAKS